MPNSMPLDRATSVLRGKVAVTTTEEREAAAARVLAELTDLLRIKVWAYRVLDAQDEEAAAIARRGLEVALAQ